MQSVADIISRHVNQGTTHRVVIECEHSKIILIEAGEKAHFIVIASGRSNHRPLFIWVDITAGKIKELFGDFHQ